MTDQPPAADSRAPAARPVLIIDIPLPPARTATPSAPVHPPVPEAPGGRTPAVPRPAPGRSTAPRPPEYEEPTIEWRAIEPRPPAAARRPVRPVPARRHLAVAGVGTAGLGLAGFLAGLLSSTAPFVAFGWACSGTVMLLVVVRVARCIGDAIGGGGR